MRRTQVSMRAVFWLSMLVFPLFLPAQTDTLSNPTPCGTVLPLTDNNCPENGPFYQPNRFLINVMDAPAGTLGVDVYLREVRFIISHDWLSDLDINLVSPGGVMVALALDNGGSGDNYGNPADTLCQEYTALSVQSCALLDEAEPPYTDQPYAPEESFFLFNDSTTTANGIWELLICDEVAPDTGSLRFFQLVFEPVSCLPLTDLTVSEVDSTTVVLDWEPQGSCGTAVIEYGPPGFQPGVDSLAGEGLGVVYAGCPPYSLMGLPADTGLDIYIRKYCSTSGSFSGNDCPVQVTTGCALPPPTIITTFDTLDLCPVFNCGAACTFGGAWQNDPQGDDFDWFINQGMTQTSNTGPDADVGGSGKYVYLETSGTNCNNGRRAVLRSHCIQLDKQGTDTCHLSFNYFMFGVNVGTLRLQASNDGGFSWQTLWQRSGNQGRKWYKSYVSLSPYEDGEVLQFRFVGIGGNGSNGDIALDNIVFFGSQDLGEPSQIYYRDVDGDGYGRADVFLPSCATEPPAGYADNADDCNDGNAAVNPGQPEVPCDQIDNNCNGLLPDDAILPPPVVTNDTVCSGQAATVCATLTDPDHVIFWYASPDSTDFIGFGNCLTFTFTNNTAAPAVYRYFAEEFDAFCQSEVRAEARIVVFPNPDLSTAEMPAVCPGQPFNLASLEIGDANFTGGDLNFHSAFPPTPENQLAELVVTPTTPTTYYFQKVTPQGCTDEGSVLLDIKPGPELTFDPGDSLSLCRENTAQVSVLATGGTPPYQYLWSNGDEGSTTEFEAAFTPGVAQLFGLAVEDAEGCFSLDSVLITTTSSIDSVRRFIEPVSTCMGSNGSITLIPLNGQPPFNFVWTGTSGQSGMVSGIADTLVIDGLEQGTYRITITDSSEEQCQFVMRQVVVNGPDVIVEGVEVTPVSCAGAADGEVCVDVSSLTGAMPVFNWGDGSTGACNSGLTGGTYSVTITGGMCETVIDNLIVDEPDTLKARADLTEPTCADTPDGVATLTLFGGTAPYSVGWSNGAAGEDLLNVPSGVYVATVTDANACTVVDTILLNAPPPLTVGLDSLRIPSCFGFDDGFVLAAGQGGTPPYQYQWNNGLTAPALTNATAGSYALTVTDLNNCITVLPLIVGQPAPIELDIVDLMHPECVGERTGEVRVAASGGIAPYSYLWNTGLPDSLLSAVSVGHYAVTVTDANNCPGDTLEVTLAAESILDLNVLIDEPDCRGPRTGRIELQPNGTGPFHYQWDSNEQDTLPILEDIAAGTYQVEIIDGRECEYDTTIVVNAPQVFAAGFAVQDPACAAEASGFIDVSFSSLGTAPFSYEWSDGVTQLDRFGLPATMLQLTVRDADTCTYVSPVITLEDPDPLEVYLDARSDILCAGEENGFIEVTFAGGTPPYSVNWLGVPDDTEDLYGLAAGNYRLILQDANGCPIDTAFTIGEPPPLLATVAVETSDPCSPDIFNQLVATVEGGTPPFEFLWSNGMTDSVLLDVPSGDYELTVRDANGCEDIVSSIKVREQIPPIQLDTFFRTNISCNGASDGTLTTVITGGQPPYLFFFSNAETILTSDTIVTLEGLSQGSNYSVTVTDMNSSCSVQSPTLSITNPSILVFRRDSVRFISCQPGGIFTTTFGGTPPFTYEWFNTFGELVGADADFFTTVPGVYYGRVTDANGCVDLIQTTALQQIGVSIDLVDTTITPVTCFDDSNGAIAVTVEGGVGDLTYLWSTAAVTESISGLPAGSYTVTVTDEVECAVVFGPFVVDGPDAPLSLQPFIDPVSCFGEADGVIEVTLLGGVSPYYLEWRRGEEVIATGENRIDSLPAGNYELTVTDAFNCLRTFEFVLGQPPELFINLQEGNGQLQATVTGGTVPYEFFWSTGDTTLTTELTGQGWYTFTVTDDRGCSKTDSILITGTTVFSPYRKVRLYPNPGRDELLLELDWPHSGAADCMLVDLTGRTVARFDLGHRRQDKIPLDVSALPGGVYLVLVRRQGALVFTGKWVRME